MFVENKNCDECIHKNICSLKVKYNNLSDYINDYECICEIPELSVRVSCIHFMRGVEKNV